MSATVAAEKSAAFPIAKSSLEYRDFNRKIVRPTGIKRTKNGS